MKQLTPEQLEKRKKLNKKLLMFLVLPTFLLLIIVMLIPKDKASQARDAAASAVEAKYNNAPITMNLAGCTLDKAIELTKGWASSWKQTAKVEHDSVVTFNSSTFGHNGKEQTYMQKVTISKMNDGVKIACSCDWDDDYAATVNQNTLDMIKLHFNNPTLKYN